MKLLILIMTALTETESGLLPAKITAFHLLSVILGSNMQKKTLIKRTVLFQKT